MIAPSSHQAWLFYSPLARQTALLKDDLLDPVDQLLDDPALVDLVRQCLAKRSPRSARTGRTGMAPDRPCKAGASECEFPRGRRGRPPATDVPKAAEEATREGVAAWQQMQQCLRELAELNKERNLQRAARRIPNEILVPSNPGLLPAAVSVPRPSSGSRPEPRLTDCRLATRVRSRERTRLRRTHSFGCHKHEIRSASRWTSCISDPRL